MPTVPVRRTWLVASHVIEPDETGSVTAPYDDVNAVARTSTAWELVRTICAVEDKAHIGQAAAKVLGPSGTST
jgi:hypothetical protein